MSGAYWPQPWSCEDGGPRRWGVPGAPHGPGEPQPGLGIRQGERLRVAAVLDAYASDMVIRREPGELYALRHTLPYGDPLGSAVEGWVDRLDPETLETVASTPRLPAGRYWPGGIAAHASGDLHMVFGRWAHRLSADLAILASRELPVDRPYNSFVVLDGGQLVTKDCDAPRGLAPSTVSVLDPVTLESLAPELPLPEPSIARLASDGVSVIAVGSETVFRIRFDADAGRLELDESWKPRYGPAPGRSYGWDPVITDDHVFWMDQGRNDTDWSMRGTGDAPDPVRLWWARHDDAASLRSVEISGLPRGTESNPPAWDPVERIIVAYDAGNAVLRAWRLEGDELVDLWRRDGLAHAAHLVLYPDTRELVAQDWRGPALLWRPRLRRAMRQVVRLLGHSSFVRRNSGFIGNDRVVVLDLDTGEERAAVDIPSPAQAFLFPAPGFGRDFYYQSMSTIARVAVEPGATPGG